MVLPAAAAGDYVDKVLDDGPQPTLTLSQELSPSSGWPRCWRAEYTLATDTGAPPRTSRGLAFSGFLDTPDHGALSGSIAVNRSDQGDGDPRRSSDTVALWRIDQRAFPLDGGWFANHSAGALSTLQAPMARSFGRIGLPSSPVEGVTGEYQREGTTLLNASLGRPGVYSGLGINGFDPARGRLLSAGGQQALPMGAGTGTLALQFFDASRVAGSVDPSIDQNARGLWSAWRWEGTAPWVQQVAPGPGPVWQREGGLQVQANVLASRATSDLPGGAKQSESGQGAWVDAQWRSQWLQQAAGAFYLQPNLHWGTFNAVSDLRGVYWRGDVAARRWQLSVSTEWADSVSGATGPNFFANLSGRYRYDTRNTAIAALAVRRLNGSGTSAQVGWEHQSEWGQTQWVADLLRAGARRSTRVGIDHSVGFASDYTLGLSAALERIQDTGVDSRAFSWGVLGSARLFSRLSLDGNVRGVEGGGARQITGNLGLTWAVDPRWTFVAQVSSTRGSDPNAFALVSTLAQAAAPAPTVATPTRIQLTLRYEDRAGSVSVPLGGAPGMGAGSLRGVVFYDADNNGRREASEAGVPNVTVILDRRYVTRTDAQGHYEFPWVAAGPHTLQIQSDDVPLPWSPLQREPVPVSVVVRSATTTDFPLQRDR
jgi:hypothetical protein